MAPSPTPAPGSPVGDLAGRLLATRYRLNRLIAKGGMAEVWEATDQVLARRVAVKLLHAHLAGDDSFVKRFRHEAIAAARLAHPSIVSVYDTFSEDGLEAIVMELVVGTTLRADLDQHGPLKLDAVLAIGSQVADALGAAHASGLVHRDVKPANILLSADGRVLVADFGIAKAAEGSDLTSDGSMIGTAKYLAPEQVQGESLDGRADLYALGVVLYEALTGVAPFVADTDASTAFARLHRDPVPPRQLREGIPPSVEAVVLKAMRRDPAERYPDARAMRLALLAAGADPSQAPAAAASAAAHATGPQQVVTPTPPPPPPSRPAPPAAPPAAARPHDTTQAPPARRRGRWGLVALLVVGAIVAAVALSTGTDGGGGSGTELSLVSATPFDPGGGDGEHAEVAPLAIDGKVETAWRTEDYHGKTDLAAPGEKGGVGLSVEVAEPASVTKVFVTSPDSGWTAKVYVQAGALPTDLAGWGDPVGSVDGASAGETPVEVDAKEGDHVLVWFTRLPDTSLMRVQEVRVEGR